MVSVHSKQTVKYICEQFSSGNEYYFKREYITHDKWSNIKSLAWSAPRPIKKETFMKRQAEGFYCEWVQKQSASLINLAVKKTDEKNQLN